MTHPIRRALPPATRRTVGSLLGLLLALVLIPLSPHPARAACPSDTAVAGMARHWADVQAGKGYGAGLSVDEAYCAQTKYLAILDRELGPRIGYKVGFTGKETQERFGVDAPARGVLYRSMLLPSGSELPADFGARPLYEADLMVRVKDAGINDATTRLEVARHLEAVVPFIELPDIIVAEGEPLNGPGIIALNVIARSGVIGEGIPVQPTAEFVDAFAAMQVTMSDETGAELLVTQGRALMGHPLDVVLWLTGHLREHGMRLEAGDMVSLGSMGGLAPPAPGKCILLRYQGLPGGEGTVEVSFR